MPKQGIPANREKIINLRKNLGLSQTELGGKAMEDNGFKKISLRTVQKIENDSNYLCSFQIIDNLSKVFDLPINELLLDESFQTSMEVEEKESSPPEPRPTTKIRPATEFDQRIVEVTSSKDSQDNENNLEINKNRKFYLTEYVLSRLEDHWLPDPTHGTPLDLYEFRPEKYEILQNLRKFKFKPTSFEELCESVGDLDESEYKVFCDHPGFPDPDTNHYKEQFKVDPVTGEIDEIDTAYRFDKGVDSFFEELLRAHFYSIGYDLPEDEETLAIMYELIAGIENYFENKISIAEELKFKYHFTSLRKQLYSKNISIFYSPISSKKLGIGKNRGQVILKAFHLRIIIKNWSNPAIIDLMNCRDYSNLRNGHSFTRVEWRDFIEIEKKDDD